MKLRKLNPATIAAPLSAYSHGIEAPESARWVYVSGQVAMNSDGSIPKGIEAQADLVFRNIAAVLAEGGMSLADLVRINTYIVDIGNMAGFRTVRDKYVGSTKPASTMIAVAALARPEFLIEIEAVAAQAPSSDGE